MKKTLTTLLLALAVAFPQARLLADEAPAKAAAGADAAPDLPKTEDLKEEPAVDANAKADVESPEGEPEVKKESVLLTHPKPGHFRWGNFFLGALGGAVLVGGIGVSTGLANNEAGNIDSSKAGILAGGGALGGGLLSILLGATSPLPATPPDMNSSLGPKTWAAAKQLVFTIQF